jgi:beta-glucosidase
MIMPFRTILLGFDIFRSIKCSLIFILIFCTVITTLNLNAQTKTIKQDEEFVVYKNKNATIVQRIRDLLKRMTLEEKVLPTNQWKYGKNANANNIKASKKAVRPEIGSLIYRSLNPVYRNDMMRKAMNEFRLGIPILMGFDVIHGYRKIYPVPLAQACLRNLNLIEQAAAVAAKESKLSDVDWTFFPMVDITRNPRWGRLAVN